MKKLLAIVLVLGFCTTGYSGDVAALTNIANGDTSDGPTVMNNFNALRDVVNGEIDNDNVKAAAGIVESKLNLAALSFENLIKNADLEEWISGTAVAPDDWTLATTPTIARDTANTGYGSYAAKITGAGASDEGIYQTITNLKISTTYRVSAQVKVTSGDTASITTTGATTNMDSNSTTASWTTVTGYFTTDGSGTDVVLYLLAQNTTDVVWFDQVIVTQGTSKVGFSKKPEIVTDRIDVVQASESGIATNDTLVLTFAFVPSEIAITFAMRTKHDTTSEVGHTTGRSLVAITGDDTLTYNQNHVYLYDDDGAIACGVNQNNTVDITKGQGGNDGTDAASCSAVGTWDTSAKQLTLTFTSTNCLDSNNLIELIATASR